MTVYVSAKSAAHVTNGNKWAIATIMTFSCMLNVLLPFVCLSR